MKKTLAAIAAAGLLLSQAGPALAAGGCGAGTQSVETNPGSEQSVAQTEQTIKAPTQTASTPTSTQ